MFKRLIFFIFIFVFLFIFGISEVLATNPPLEFISQLSGRVYDVDVEGNLVSIINNDEVSEVRIVDVTDPATPILRGNLTYPNCIFTAIDVVETLGYASQTSVWCSPKGTLHVFDVSTPDSPTEIGRTSIVTRVGGSQEIMVLGNHAYIANANGGLIIVDVGDPQNPQMKSVFAPTVPSPGIIFVDVYVLGNKAFVADAYGKLWVVDVGNPSSPNLLGIYQGIFGTPSGIFVKDNLAYLTTGGTGLKIFDITNPSAIILVGEYDTPGYALDVVVSETYAFIADEKNKDGQKGVRVIDVSNPTNPKEVAFNETIPKAWKLAIQGQYIYVADYQNGLFILKYSPLPPTSPTPFLDLPWDYQEENLSFNDAALSINSYFDHEYPLLSTSLSEPATALGTLGFDGEKPPRRNYSSHDGYDWGRNAKATLGKPVLAAADGVASARGVNDCGPCGNHILIDHENGYQTRYYHLMDEDLIVATNSGESKRVSKGQKVGLVGYSGNVKPKGEKGAHIHFMVVQDKDGDGDFDDNIPDGLIDPFGWTGKEEDPWPIYSFNYKGAERKGNKSHYLWTKKLESRKDKLTVDTEETIDLGVFSFLFPQATFDKDVSIFLGFSPIVKPTDTLESLGPTLSATARDLSGNEVFNLLRPLSLTIDYSSFDLTRFNPDTLSIYSSSDGNAWNKEETLIDTFNYKATADISHFSLFGLFAERIDTLPPITTPVFAGSQGNPGWYRSDTKVSLDAQDNQGGLGVDYTLYRVGEEDWKEYQTPLIFANEGNYPIEFYSVDNDENIEETKSINFSIDKTLPEAKIVFNPTSLRMEIKGVDDNGQTTIQRQTLNKTKFPDRLVIADKAGNSLVMDGYIREDKNPSEVSIGSLGYNDNPSRHLSENILFTISTQDKNKVFKSLLQTFYWKGNILVTLLYQQRTKTTTVVTKIPNQKPQKQTLPGLTTLFLRTDNANLEYGYK